MMVPVKLFAAAKQVVGQDAVEVELPAGATVADLRRELESRYSELTELFARAVFSIDAEYVHDDAVLPKSGEIACIPPVSGG